MEGALDAATVRDAMARYLDLLREHREELDSLNVFPVPDGDTGTNLLMTQQAVADAVGAAAGETLDEVVETASRAALLGARGNSGVILSQVLRGLADRLRGSGGGDATTLAAALRRAADEAWRAVAEPVEGTMLTVLRDAASAAEEAAGAGSVSGVADAALEGGSRSLERTPELLPDLARAGVVDAGAKGIVLLLDALAATIRGGASRVEVGPLGPVGRELDPATAGTGSTYGHEVMYLLECEDEEVPSVRRQLGELGDSLVVVGGGGLYTVHVHTDRPDEAVRAGERAGAARQVRVTSLDEQVAERCLAGEARAVRVHVPPRAATACALVAVSPGPGVTNLFRSLGADVVAGGPGALPSVEELVRAIDGAPSDAVLVLANHRNVRPAAVQAAGETRRRVEVVATESVPEGITAAAAFNPDAPIERNLDEVNDARGRVAAAEVARAVRDADTPAGAVRAGDALGVVRGAVTRVGADALEVAVEVARSILSEEHEAATVVLGADVDGEGAARTREAFAAAFPDLEIEVHRGDQPSYPYLIGLE